MCHTMKKLACFDVYSIRIGLRAYNACVSTFDIDSAPHILFALNSLHFTPFPQRSSDDFDVYTELSSTVEIHCGIHPQNLFSALDGFFLCFLGTPYLAHCRVVDAGRLSSLLAWRVHVLDRLCLRRIGVSRFIA